MISAALALSLLPAGCTSGAPATPKSSQPTRDVPAGSAANTTSTPGRSVTVDTDRAFVCRTVADLMERSDLVVEGTALAVESFDYDTTTYSKVTLQVKKCLWPADAVKSGDTVTVVELGGITSEAALIRANGNKFGQTIGAKEENAKVQILFDGAPLPVTGEKVTYFLARDALGVLSEDYYAVVGAEQGKLKLSNGRFRRFVGKDNEGLLSDLDANEEQLAAEVAAAPRKGTKR